MKKLSFISVLALFFMLSLGVGKAQDSKIALGGGFAYATDISSPGLFIKGNYAITENWEAAADFSYFFPKDYGWGAKYNWMALNFDGHYVFARPEKMAFYGLAGIDILIARFGEYEYMGYKTESSSKSYFGLNLGAGGRYGINDKISALAEIKYVIVEGGYAQFNLGILFHL